MASGSDDSGTEHSRPQADWRRVADGVFLAGLGVFFLLATSRGLPEGFWIEAAKLWPVLLVSFGIRIVFEKTRFAYGMVLGPAVVLGTLFWLAWGDRPQLPPPGEWQALSVDRPEGLDRARVQLHLGGASVDLDARPLPPTLLAEGRVAARDNTTRLHLTDEEGEATLRLGERRQGILLIGLRHETWELGVTDQIPLSLDLSGAGVSANVDLRRGHAADSRVRGAFNTVTLHLPRTAEQVTIQLKGAFNSFDVIVPEGTPVSYEGPGFPIGWINEGPAADSLSEDEPGYRVILDGAFTFLDIDEGPPPEGGWSEPLPPATHPAKDEPHPPAEDPDGETTSAPS
jgi:hypothetical protein